MTVEIVGGETFARTLRQFGEDIQALTDAHAAAGDAVATAAAARARRRTGALASSFAGHPAESGVQVGSPLRYAGVQEYGWARHGITPSYALTGALEDSADQVEAIYTDAVDAALSRVSGK